MMSDPPAPPPLPTLNFRKIGGIDLLVDNLKKVSLNNSSHVDSQDSSVRSLVNNLQINNSVPASDDNQKQKTFLSFYRHVDPVIQVGPSCGLAALAMAGQVLTGQYLDPECLLTTSIQHGFSYQGEMFSANDLLTLALEMLPTCSAVLLTNSDSREVKVSRIMETLLNQGAVLIPYDRDANGEPCLKQGQKAHWALLTGVLLVTTDVITSSPSTYNVDSSMPNLLHVCSAIGWPKDTSSAGVFVYAVHGRSSRTCSWRLDGLLDSNQQLITVNRKLDGDNQQEFHLPAGGIKAGLCGNVILLTSKS